MAKEKVLRESSSWAIQRFFPRSGVNYTCRFHVILSSINKAVGYRI